MEWLPAPVRVLASTYRTASQDGQHFVFQKEGCVTNRVRISGTLKSLIGPRVSGQWYTASGMLATDRGFDIPLFATGKRAVEQLLFYGAGKAVVVVGSLSKSPEGAIQIAVGTVCPPTITDGPETKCTHRMDAELSRIYVPDNLRDSR
jgi:hypothetical protein